MAAGIDLHKAYAALDIPPARYIAISIGITLLTILAVLAMQVLLPAVFVGYVALLLWTIPLYIVVVLFLYPYLVAEKKKGQINHNIHYFISHMAVLGTTDIARTEVMDMLGRKREYGPLADDARKIHMLVENWHMGLPDACRFIAGRTPSYIWSDFLERFAYSIDSGETLDSFLSTEQSVLMEDFGTLYQGALYEVENLKNTYQSLILSLVFIFVVSALLPLIQGGDGTFIIGGALVLGMVIELTFAYWMRAKAPVDPIWHDLPIDTDLTRALKRSLPISVGGAVLITIPVLIFFPVLPVPFIIAAALTPLIYTGSIVSVAEEKVKRRDDNFGAFIRSLGASTASRGGLVTPTLGQLRHHDFGPLTQNVRDLYMRLAMRLDDAMAWTYFAADCGSNLIEKFSRIFNEGVRAGGSADSIGRIINHTFVSILSLRKARFQSANAFKGLMYGLLMGMAFALYVGLGIIGQLSTIFTDVEMPANSPFEMFFGAEINLELISFMVFLLLLAHSMVSAMMIRIAEGGDLFRAYTDFPKMVWIAAIISWAAEKTLLSVL